MPWPNGPSAQKFLMELLRAMNGSSRKEYQPAAEALGMTLDFISKMEDAKKCLEGFLKKIHTYLKSLQTNEDKLIYCLDGICKHYSPVAGQYVSYLLARISRVAGNFKASILRILKNRIEEAKSNLDFPHVKFEVLLSEVNWDIRILTLEIILKSLDRLHPSMLLTNLKEVLSNGDALCRSLAYDILIGIHKLNKGNPNRDGVMKTCKEYLLSGLADLETEIQMKMFDFWSEESADRDHGINHLDSLTDRLIFILKDMYDPITEDHYLNYSVYLLLKLLRSEDLEEKIYNYALIDCIFKEYKIQSHWKRQHASMTPLFVSSQRTSSLASLGNDWIETNAPLEFEPTKPATLSEQIASVLEERNSTLMFNAFKDPNTVVLSDSYRRRRFHKDKSKISRDFAFREVEKVDYRNKLRKDVAVEKERGVVIYRKYRIGEFPDIEISLGEVVRPLQMLAKVILHFFLFYRLNKVNSQFSCVYTL